MTFSNRGNNSYGGGQNYTRRDTRDQGSDRPALFDAVCAQCGSACKVPFKPNGRKEVFCSKCFENIGGNTRESRRGGGSNFADRQMFRATCDQCGQGCEVPFRPTNGKSVFCSNCFADSKIDYSRSDDRPNAKPSVAGKDYGFELEQINSKLDKVLKLLSPLTPKETSKEATTKILTEIETNLEKTPAVTKKKKKKPVLK